MQKCVRSWRSPAKASWQPMSPPFRFSVLQEVVGVCWLWPCCSLRRFIGFQFLFSQDTEYCDDLEDWSLFKLEEELGCFEGDLAQEGSRQQHSSRRDLWLAWQVLSCLEPGYSRARLVSGQEFPLLMGKLFMMHWRVMAKVADCPVTWLTPGFASHLGEIILIELQVYFWFLKMHFVTRHGAEFF